MADNKENLSRPRFLKGFLGAGFASIFLGKSAVASTKNNQDGSSSNVRLKVRQDPRIVSRVD
jgi:hypothetical protein